MRQKVTIRDKIFTLTTLCILLKGNPTRKLLLGYKKTGFGKGKYTGFGGKVEAGESVADAAARELLEETGVRVAISDLCLAGRVTFWFPHKPQWSQLVHVFTTRKWVGEPVESEEMLPSWFGVDQIPFERMWQDGAHWLPPVLAGQRFEADFEFQADNETIQEVKLALKESL